MKKIQTLFKRVFEDHKIVKVLPEVTSGMEWVLDGEGTATVKYDGACCAVIDGELYKRYDAKNGRKPPEGAIPCCNPDPVTGHHPHWVKCNRDDPSDKWFFAAYERSKYVVLEDDLFRNDRKLKTYEAVGMHFNGNPYGYTTDILMPHGCEEVSVKRTFEGIRDWLEANNVEGLVFWKDGEPRCKIKRTDFGFSWNGTKKGSEI